MWPIYWYTHFFGRNKRAKVSRDVNKARRVCICVCVCFGIRNDDDDDDRRHETVSYCKKNGCLCQIFSHVLLKTIFPFSFFHCLCVLLWIIIMWVRTDVGNIHFGTFLYTNSSVKKEKFPHWMSYVIVGYLYLFVVVINDGILCVKWITDVRVVKRASRHHHVKSKYHLISVYVSRINKTQWNNSYHLRHKKQRETWFYKDRCRRINRRIRWPECLCSKWQ